MRKCPYILLLTQIGTFLLWVEISVGTVFSTGLLVVVLEYLDYCLHSPKLEDQCVT